MKRLYPLLLAATALIITGCPSFTTLHTATPVEKGTAEITGAAGLSGASGNFFNALGAANTDGGVNFNGALPYIGEIHGRYGVSDNLGIGGRVSSFGMFGVDANIAPVNTDAFAFSLNPAVTVVPLGLFTYGTVEGNALVDIVKSDSVTVTMGAKGGGIWATAADSSGITPYVGPTVGAEFWVNKRVAIAPWFDGVWLTDTLGNSNVFTYFAMLGIKAKVGSLPGDSSVEE
jgi:hypothetical protein